MALDPVPWFVGGGAMHSPEVARTLAYAATGGTEGIVTPGDLKVSATAVPGSTVQVATGAAVILNRAASQSNQSYVARASTADTATIAATTASGPRTDLIVVQVEDPWLSGEPWQDPTDPTVGPYVFTRVISNVPAGTTRLQEVSGYEGRSAVTLARVTVPASTATITSAMITDLRRVARPRTDRTIQQAAVSANFAISASSAAPAPADGAVSAINVYVPTWATKANISMTVVGVTNSSSNVAGGIHARIGTDVATNETYYQEQTAGASRLTYVNEDTVAIPAALRGTTQRLRTYARRSSNSASGGLNLNTTTQIFWDVEFTEAAA